MRFEWDDNKENLNIKKHKISFEDAKSALTCGLVIALREEIHHDEQRYVFLGICKRLNILVVVVAYPDDMVTRIISARKATKTERQYYEKKI